MNSEELEQSLRTEFESYLKNVLADMRQEVSEFQKQFEAEFEKHKSQVDEVFQNFSARLNADRELDAGFTESVIEHLRLSRDEGARITAMAIAEAEELEKQKAAETAKEQAQTFSPSANFNEIRDAVNDISTKTTQSSILKTLVQHAGQFTPRGAFFIIKNEHFVGWRVFGKDGEGADEEAVREVFFPVSLSSVLGESVRSLSAVESSYGVYEDDSVYLNKLEFGQPEQMFAVPLVVRGRSVAVLYADRGLGEGDVNIEALETLVRVASMTVEILASSRGAHPQSEQAEESAAGYNQFEESSQAENYESTEEETQTLEETEAEQSYQFVDAAPVSEESAEPQTAAVEEYSYESPAEEDFSEKTAVQTAESFEDEGFSFKPSVEEESENAEFVSETANEKAVAEISTDETLEDVQGSFEENQPAFETEDFYSQESETAPSYQTETPTYEIPEPAEVENEYAQSLNGSDYEFETNPSFEAPQAEYESVSQTYEAPQYEVENFAPTNGTYETATMENGKTESYAAEAPVETAIEPVIKQPAKSRFSERNVDLPIEVSDDERRLHNDARRFARLLVSEIKLYNEQKVKEGRESSDLYERLREAIDRSREMYDKRVQPPVAAKFDYFHYELVSSLAEGDMDKLGASYPGSNV